MIRPKPTKIFFLLFLTFFSCQKANQKLYSDINLHPTNRKGSFASKQTIEGLLYEIWESGFIRKNELTKQEILNNAYGVFRKAPKTLSDPDGRAYYHRREGKKDLLMLNANLFGHLEPAPKQPHMDNVRVKKLDKAIRATLVHELFHDFWHNILDERKRLLFSAEADIFFVELMLAKTEQQKQRFLDDIGLGLQVTSDFESFEVLLEILDLYSPEKAGTELFSVLAGLAFSEEIVIPKPFRKYYSVLVSDQFLNTDRFSSAQDSGQKGKNPQQENPGYFSEIEKSAAPWAWNPIFLAALHGQPEISESLMKTGVQIDGRDKIGRSPLHIAAQKGHVKLIGILLRYGANIHSQDAVGMNPLHMAALCDRLDTASFLITKGANTRAKDFAGQTPLHLASFGGDKNLAELLIAEGAKIDERDNRGETALHLAAFCGHQEIVELLIEHGAESDIRNIHRVTPQDIATRAGNEKIVEILRGHSKLPAH